jgi:hypothetical protein
LGARRLPQTEIGNVSARIVTEPHSLDLRGFSKIFDDHANHEPVTLFPYREHFDLLHPASYGIGDLATATRRKIASETLAAELRRKPLTFPNCRGNPVFSYSPLEYSS